MFGGVVPTLALPGSVANNSESERSVYSCIRIIRNFGLFVAQTLGLLICVFRVFGRHCISTRDVICREPIRLAVLFTCGYSLRRGTNPRFTDTSVSKYASNTILSHISNDTDLISASVLFKILGARALEATNFIHSLNDLIIFNLATLVYPLYSIITFDVRKILSAY